MAISGSGNVAIYAAYKCLEFGAKVITLSDSGGYHIVEDGMTKEMIDAIDDIKVTKKGRLHEYKNDKGELCPSSHSCSGCLNTILGYLPGHTQCIACLHQWGSGFTV